MPVSVAFSQWIGVVCCGCPSHCNVSLVVFASFAFEKSTLNSTFDVDVATNFSIWHWVKTAPLRWMGCLSYGVHPREKCPAVCLYASLADKCEAY